MRSSAEGSQIPVAGSIVVTGGIDVNGIWAATGDSLPVGGVLAVAAGSAAAGNPAFDGNNSASVAAVATTVSHTRRKHIRLEPR